MRCQCFNSTAMANSKLDYYDASEIMMLIMYAWEKAIIKLKQFSNFVFCSVSKETR